MLWVLLSIVFGGFLTLLLTVYVIVPFIFLCFPQRFLAIVYNYKDNPLKERLNEVEIFDLSPLTSRSFFIESQFDGAQIGVWHILPYEQKAADKVLANEHFEKKLNDGSSIFIYFHGVSGNRAVNYRVGVYKLLSRLGFHVLTMDYRGFGDSQGRPKGEIDVVSDAVSLIHYVKRCAPKSNVFIWGHSMGSGVASSAYRYLQENRQGHLIRGILIDAGYYRLRAAVHQNRKLRLFRPKPIMQSVVNSILKSVDVEFHSIENLKRASVPISIIHSEDDPTIPFEIGKQLHTALLDDVKDVTFINLGKNGYGHLYNYTDPEIEVIVRDLVQRAKRRNKIDAVADR